MEAEASGAAEDGSSDLLQAAAAKNIEIKSRIRTLRIASSLIPRRFTPSGAKRDVQTPQEYFTRKPTSSSATDSLRIAALQKSCAISRGNLTLTQVSVLFQLESPDVVYEEDGGLELRWWLAGRRGFHINGASRVVEPELDMRRPVPNASPIAQTVARVIRWMTPEHSATRAPMRSVARELEEAFPSRDN